MSNLSQKQPAEDTSPKPVATMDTARRMLASIEADIRQAEAQIHRSVTEGHTHFQGAMEEAQANLQDDTLDGWSLQAAAMARVGTSESK